MTATAVDHLLGQETCEGTNIDSSDEVTFLVGIEGDKWTLPARKSELICNPVFYAMLEGPLAKDGDIIITDVDGRAFNNLLQYYQGTRVELQTVTTASNTLYAAHKYNCPELTQTCLNFLHQHVNAENICCVLPLAVLLRHDITPTAPAHQMQNCSENHKEIVSAEHLVDYCLDIIDANASIVLNQERFEDLSPECVQLILERDTLQVSSELEVFNCLHRWSICSCQKRGLPVTPNNCQKVLKPSLFYTCRFLLMDMPSFLEGPAKSGIIDSVEQACIIAFLMGDKDTKKLPRNMPVILTPRKKGKTGKLKKYKKVFKKCSSDNKKNIKIEKSMNKKECKDGKSSKLIQTLITILAIVFD